MYPDLALFISILLNKAKRIHPIYKLIMMGPLTRGHLTDPYGTIRARRGRGVSLSGEPGHPTRTRRARRGRSCMGRIFHEEFIRLAETRLAQNN